METNYTKNILLSVVLLAVLSVAGYMYYTKMYRPQKEMTYTADAKAAYDNFVSGDYSGSVGSINALVAQAPSKSELGRLKILLGVSYWFRDQSGDRTQAIKTLKEVVNDYSIPAAWRAQALNSIARFVNDSSLSFYQVHFSEAPYNAFVPAEGTEAQKVSAVYLALLKYSDDTYPTSWAEYAIAYQYASLSAFDRGNQAELAELITSYVNDGDTRNDQSIYAPSVLVQGYHYRALAIARGAVLSGLTAESIKRAEDAYSLVFKTALETGQDEKLVPLLSRTRFYNANFLSLQNGREEEIKTLLQPFATIDPNVDGRFFAALADVEDTNFNKQVAIKLAKISPEFRSFLVRAGVLAN